MKSTPGPSGRRPAIRGPGATPPRSAKPAAGRTRTSTPAETRSIRWLLVSAGICAFPGLVLLVLYAAPQLQGRHEWLAMAASFAPYGWLAWLTAVVLWLAGARGRTRLVAAPLALCLAWHTGILVPYLPEPTRASAAPQSSLSLLELNLRFGLADIDALSDRVREAHPDVLVLTEATTADHKALQRATWAHDYPYLLGTAGNDYDRRTDTGDARGTLVASRYPVSPLGTAEGTAFTNIAVRLALPGHPVTLIAAHPANPEHGVDRWLRDGEAVTRLALQYSAGPLVVAGDLNATSEHLTLRELTAKAGLTDTVSGHGWQPTFPADAWYPPLIQIDHVLVSRQFTATAYRTVRVPGTDHLGLLVRLSMA